MSGLISPLTKPADLDAEQCDAAKDVFKCTANVLLHLVGTTITNNPIDAVMVMAWALSRLAHMSDVPLDMLERVVARTYAASVAQEQAKTTGGN